MNLKGRQLEVRYGSHTILHQVDFAAQKGELIGILGPSGSGKSTLLMALSGFRPARAGAVTFAGKDLYQDFEELKPQIGFVPQDDIVPTSLTVDKVLRYAAELRLPDFTQEARQGRIDGVIGRLGLSERRKLRVGRLSGGQRKRVSVAVELLTRPPLLFADEPTSGLDPALEAELMQELSNMATEGRIIVVTTHIMSSLTTLDMVCVLNGGRVAYFGPPQEIKNYFKVSDYLDIYKALPTQSPEAWQQSFAASSLYRDHLRARL